MMMRKFLGIFCLMVAVVVAEEGHFSVVRGLIERTLPDHASNFKLETLPSESGKDVFEINTVDSFVVIRASSPVAAASAVNWYLKYHCNVTVSWSGTNKEQLIHLPKLKSPVRQSRSVQYSYYQNVCTVSYSMVWWDWKRWEQEIDWMAMNGINMPLAFTGLEYVWRIVFKKMGLTTEEMDHFWTGPAFFAWQRMGNIRGWAGPLPDTFIDAQHTLQLQILKRMRDFGMKPVLPGFAGFVPEALTRVYPQANLTQSTRWGNWNSSECCDYVLQPTDPLYLQIGKEFYTALVDTYGTDHFYSCDTYNEMLPPTSNPDYLASSSKAVISSMTAVDPKAVWVMQTWLFIEVDFWKKETIKAYLGGVGNDQMLLLDLDAWIWPTWTFTDNFFGKPFIWCTLHNYGGNVGLSGNLDLVAAAPVEAMKSKGSTMVGVGITMEGINQNYAQYDLTLEMGWRHEPVDVDHWLTDFARMRYGKDHHATAKAWHLIRRSAYNCTQDGGVTKSFMEIRPGLNLHRHEFMPTELYYNPAVLVNALRLFLSAVDDLPLSATLEYDAVDLTRQVLSNLFIVLSDEFRAAYEAKSLPKLRALGREMLALIADMDRLLSSNEHFLLGSWLESARQWGATQTEKDFYEWNARNQVTLWGPDGQISDYASKQWGGLMSDYYLPRWKLFVRSVVKAVADGQDFDQDAFATACLALEEAWQHATHPFPSSSFGDSISIARHLAKKYHPRVEAAYGEINVAGEADGKEGVHRREGGGWWPWMGKYRK